MNWFVRFALASVVASASSTACVAPTFWPEPGDADVETIGPADGGIQDAALVSTLSVSTTGTGGGTVVSDPGGISCTATSKSDDCTEVYADGTTVTLTATPALGSIFAGWSGGCGGSATTCTVNVSSEQTVTAMFNTGSYLLTVIPSGPGSGTTESAPAGIINCASTAGVAGGDCTESLPAGTIVTLTATAASGHTFAGWSGGGCTGTAASCTVSLTSDQTVTPTFNPPGYKALTIAPKGTGSASITGSGITCKMTLGTVSGDCTESFTTGTAVTLTAASSGGSTFTGWSGGGCSGTATTCTVTMASDLTVTATYTAPNYVLTMTPSGTGVGSITSSPSGLSCILSSGIKSGICSLITVSGTTVTLTATPAAGSAFGGWSGGGCSGTAATCKVSMTSAQSVTATFTLGTYTLTIVSDTGNAAGAASVSSTPSGIGCSISGNQAAGTCTFSYAGGTAVTLKKLTYLSYKSTWSCSQTDTCALTMTADSTVIVNFL